MDCSIYVLHKRNLHVNGAGPAKAAEESCKEKGIYVTFI